MFSNETTISFDAVRQPLVARAPFASISEKPVNRESSLANGKP
ncbi:MAG TPA: hypothetical protein VNI84_20545 [Pyrinomonadaceae bacterium]|nr:hypothetical protein [Pyrinomonadaceae bacterium]